MGTGTFWGQATVPKETPGPLGKMGKVYIGTSGFQYGDWIGEFYSPTIKPAQMLSAYEGEKGLNAVELNFTYYTLPSARTLASMVKRTSSDFRFTVRSHREMTHEIWHDEARRELKETAPVFRAFREGIAPLRESGRLGSLLLQFPSFFWPREENLDYLRRSHELLKGIPTVVEFRNRAWLREETFDFLKREGLGFCIVDEPKLPRLLPYTPRATSGAAYFRFHGRNPNWFGADKHERYNYLYSREELKSFLPDIEAMARERETYVFFNNCYGAKAARNALELKHLLGEAVA